jgi:hypothetical protein
MKPEAVVGARGKLNAEIRNTKFEVRRLEAE